MLVNDVMVFTQRRHATQQTNILSIPSSHQTILSQSHSSRSSCTGKSKFSIHRCLMHEGPKIDTTAGPRVRHLSGNVDMKGLADNVIIVEVYIRRRRWENEPVG